MNKTFKRLILLLAFVFSVCSFAVFAVACNDGATPGSENITYSVTVTADSDDVTLTSLKVQWRKGSEDASDEIALDADGKAEVSLAPDTYTIRLTGVPAGFDYPAATTVTATSPAATIAITEHKVDYTVSVTYPADVTLTGVKAQLYSGQTAVGSAVDVVDGSATLNARSGDYTVQLSGLPDYVTYTPASVTSTTTSADITVTLTEVDYTVNVTAASGVTLPEELKVALYAGTVKKTDDVALTDGSAKFTLTAGEYAVQLSGLTAALDYTAATVSYTERTASVTVSSNTLTLTLDIPANVTIADKTAISVNLKDSAGADVLAEAVNFDADGVAVLTVPKADYSVEISGLANNVKAYTAAITASDKTATVYLAAVPTGGGATFNDGGYIDGNPFTISGEGRYYITFAKGTYGSEAHIEFTAPEDGTWKFTWDVAGVEYDELNDFYPDTYDVPAPSYSGAGELQFVLPESETTDFCMMATAETGFVLTVTKLPFPPEGSSEINPKAVVEGENTIDLTGTAYFVLPMAEEGYSYTLTFGDGITAIANLYNASTWHYEDTELESGVPFKLGEWSTTALKIVAEEGVEIKFTFTKTVTPGAWRGPIELAVDQAAEYSFTESGSGVVWYKLHIDTAGDYIVNINASGNDFPGLGIYSEIFEGDVYSHSDVQIGEDVYGVTEEEDRVFTFVADTDYYIALTKSWGSSGSFTISKYVPKPPVDGDKKQPIAAQNGKNVVPQDGRNTIYYKYTVASAGNLILSMKSVDNAMITISIYDNANYSGDSEVYSSYSSDGFWLKGNYSDTLVTVEEGQVLYFSVNTNIYYGELDSVEFYISVIPTAATNLTDGVATLADAVADTPKTAYYTYTPAKSGLLSVSTAADVDATIVWFNASGTKLETAPSTVTAGNALYFTVTYTYSGNTPSDAKITLSVLEATALTQDSITVGTATASAQTAFYKYTVPASGRYAVKATASVDDVTNINVTCTDEENQPISALTGNGTYLTEGTVILIKVVYSLTGSAGDSPVTVTLNIGIVKPEVLQVGTMTYSIEETAISFDKYMSFTATEDGTLKIVASYEPRPSFTYGDPSYTKPDGSSVTASDDGIAMKAGDTIYIDWNLAASCDGDYTVTLTVTFTPTAA